MVQRPGIILITVSTHTGPKFRVWFALEPSNTQYKGCGIKDISEGVDTVSNDPVSCTSLVVKASSKGEKPAKWEEPWSQACNLL